MSSAAHTAATAQRLRGGTAAVAVAVLLGLVAAFLMSRAHHDHPQPTSAQVAPGPYALQQYAEKLTAFASTPGYGDVAIDHAGSSVTLYWKGSPPADVEKVIASAPPGIRASIRTSAFSNAELTDAANRLLTQAPANVRSRLAYAEAQSNRSGLAVGVTGTVPVDERALSEVAGVPVTVKYGEQKPSVGPAAQ